MEQEAKILLNLFNEVWWNFNHLNAIKKSDEFWFKYNKSYLTLNDKQKELYSDVCWEATYREKFLTEKEKIQYENWLDKLIPVGYFDKNNNYS